jgi:hypothetical protein
MAVPVVTVAAGGIPVVDVTLIPAMTRMGAPVSEAAPGMGVAVTKVTTLGVPVVYAPVPP